jgi:hypothetical protein
MDPIGRLELIAGGMFSGKCHAKDAMILMADGYTRKVQDIVRGDLVMGDDSTPRTVIDTTSGRGELFRISQSDGADYTVNSHHILSLKNSVAYDAENPLGAIVNISRRSKVGQTILHPRLYPLQLIADPNIVACGVSRRTRVVRRQSGSAMVRCFYIKHGGPRRRYGDELGARTWSYDERQ